ncbi:MAG: tetratricopeptide (TPR) repeat protein, partial [Mariniblastus sp.]
MMFRIETWICTTLFAAGIIAGMTYLNLSGYTSTGAAIDSTETANLDSGSVPGAGSEEKLAPSEAIYQQLAQQTGDSTGVANIDSQIFSKGDMYLVAGNYALALENYYDYEQIVVKSGSSILLRQAFCCEMQKRYRRAEEKYYLALTQENSTASHQLMGHAGLARCLAKEGKRSEAIDMLAEQILKLDQLEGVPEEIRSQIVYQFAKVLESYAMGDQTDLTLPNTVVFEDTQPQTEFFLDAIDQPEVSITAAVPADFQFKILQRPSNSLNVISVSISATWEPIEMLLGQIASQADQTLVMSSKAQAAIANRARTVQLQSSPLSSLLDQILIPFDLVWYQVDSELHIIAHDEVPPEVAPRQFWIDASLRAYRRFELAFDSGHRRQASMLSRGNLSFIQNNLDAAANHYQELAQTQPHAEILAKLFFNQAKLSMLLDRTEDANQSLYL